MPSLVSKCAPTSCKCSTFLNDFPSRNVEKYIFPTLRPPCRRPGADPRKCGEDAPPQREFPGAPGDLFRSTAASRRRAHSVLPGPPAYRARAGGAREKSMNFPRYFSVSAGRGSSTDLYRSPGSPAPPRGSIYLFFQSALTGTPHCTPPSVNHARSAAASWREDSRIFLRFSEIWPFQKRVILETTVHQTLSEIGPIDAVTLRNA